MILGFIVSIFGVIIILGGFIMPRYYAVFVPPHRRDEGAEKTIPNEPKGQVIARAINDPDIDGGEAGSRGSSSEEKHDNKEKASPEVSSSIR